MWHVMLFYTLLAICAGYALWKGGSPERLGAVIILLGTLLTLLVAPDKTWNFKSVHVGIFLVDLAMFVAFVALALFAARFWPIWMSAMQGFGIVGHLSQWVAPSIAPVVYATSHAVASYPILVLLGFATYWHQRRTAKGATDPAWSGVVQHPLSTKN